MGALKDPEAVDKIKVAIEDKIAYEKLLAEKINSDHTDKVKKYIKKDYDNDQAIQHTADLQNSVDEQSKRIDRLIFAALMTCDAKAGVVIKTWTDAKCEGKPEWEMTAKWGECTKV